MTRTRRLLPEATAAVYAFDKSGGQTNQRECDALYYRDDGDYSPGSSETVRLTWVCLAPAPGREEGFDFDNERWDEVVGSNMDFEGAHRLTYDISNGLDSDGYLIAWSQRHINPATVTESVNEEINAKR